MGFKAAKRCGLERLRDGALILSVIILSTHLDSDRFNLKLYELAKPFKSRIGEAYMFYTALQEFISNFYSNSGFCLDESVLKANEQLCANIRNSCGCSRMKIPMVHSRVWPSAGKVERAASDRIASRTTHTLHNIGRRGSPLPLESGRRLMTEGMLLELKENER